MTANAVIFYDNHPVHDEAECVHWSALAVTPPDEDDHLLIPIESVGCRTQPAKVGYIKDFISPY